MATEISVIQRDDTFLLFFNGARMARDLSPSRDEPSTFRFGTRSEGVSRRGRGGRVCRSMRRRDSNISAAPVKTRPNAKRARSSHPFPSVSRFPRSKLSTERSHPPGSESIIERARQLRGGKARSRYPIFAGSEISHGRGTWLAATQYQEHREKSGGAEKRGWRKTERFTKGNFIKR